MVFSITESYSDVFTNRLIVGIHELTQEKTDLFWEIFGLPSNMITLKSSQKSRPYVTVRPGSGIYASASDSSSSGWPHASVGFRAYRINPSGTRINGFTTAGHVGMTMSRLYRTGTLVGNLYDYRYEGTSDFAFYDATSGTTLSNITAYSDDMGNDSDVVSLDASYVLTNNVSYNSLIMKVGSRTFYSHGYLVDTNYTAHYDDAIITNLIRTSAKALAGDSGGAVFVEYGGKYCILGNISGGDGTYSYVTKFEIARTALDSTIYLY